MCERVCFSFALLSFSFSWSPCQCSSPSVSSSFLLFSFLLPPFLFLTLLSPGANVNIVDEIDFNTPLFLCVLSSRLHSLTHAQSPLQLPPQPQPQLQQETTAATATVATAVTATLATTATKPEGSSLLTSADLRIMEILLKFGVNLQALNKDGETVLHVCVKGKRVAEGRTVEEKGRADGESTEVGGRREATRSNCCCCCCCSLFVFHYCSCAQATETTPV